MNDFFVLTRHLGFVWIAFDFLTSIVCLKFLNINKNLGLEGIVFLFFVLINFIFGFLCYLHYKSLCNYYVDYKITKTLYLLTVINNLTLIIIYIIKYNLLNYDYVYFTYFVIYFILFIFHKYCIQKFIK